MSRARECARDAIARRAAMAKGATKAGAILVKLVSTARTGFFYVKRKNPKRVPRKLEFVKYDPRVRRTLERRARRERRATRARARANRRLTTTATRRRARRRRDGTCCSRRRRLTSERDAGRDVARDARRDARGAPPGDARDAIERRR